MDKIINLRSREGSENYLKLLKSTDPKKESSTYLVCASEGVIPEYDLEGGRYANIIDGPNIHIGTEIEGNVVKFIDFIPGYGCVITF